MDERDRVLIVYLLEQKTKLIEKLEKENKRLRRTLEEYQKRVRACGTEGMASENDLPRN